VKTCVLWAKMLGRVRELKEDDNQGGRKVRLVKVERGVASLVWYLGLTKSIYMSVEVKV